MQSSHSKLIAPIRQIMITQAKFWPLIMAIVCHTSKAHSDLCSSKDSGLHILLGQEDGMWLWVVLRVDLCREETTRVGRQLSNEPILDQSLGFLTRKEHTRPTSISQGTR